MALKHAWWWFPCWASRGYLVSSRLYIKLSFTSSPYLTLLRSVFDGNSQNYSISIIILHSNQVRHHYNCHKIFFGILKTKMPLIMQKKTDFFFNHKIWHFLSFLEILIGIWLISLHIVKISDPKIIFMLQGFLIFALHSMRNTQVRKNMKKFINSISSVFSVSIDIRLLVLRTVFRVARLSADQRAFQKKDEYRFSILCKEQLHNDELTGQSKWGWGCMGGWIAVVLNLNRNRT